MPDHIPEMLITKKSVLQMIPFSYTTLWAMTNSGEFPSPIVLNPGSKHKRIAWKLSEVEAWIASRPTGMGSGPAVEVHQRRTALAQQRLTAGVAAAQLNQRPSLDAHCDRSEHPNSSQAIDHASQAIQPNQIPSPDDRRDRAEHPNSSQVIDASLQAIVTKPETAARPRPVLLSEAEKRALVRAT